MEVGKHDVFERKYMGKFRELAARFGEFVQYERDRGARDIGLHLTRRKPDGSEDMSTTLSWFQMKGMTDSVMPLNKFQNVGALDIRLEVRHLKYWYLQPMPTYLVVYVESADEFLVTDIQKYVKKHWGNGILKEKAKTLVASIPKHSVLDDQAFRLILREGDVASWMRVLGITREEARLCHRDANLIRAFGTAAKRKVEHRAIFRSWISKCRSEVYFSETEKGEDDWENIHEHWQLTMGLERLEETFPYLEFSATDDAGATGWNGEDDDCYCPPVALSNGQVIYAREYGGEYGEYTMSVRLRKKLGTRLFQHLIAMEEAGFLLRSAGGSSIDVAPWHHRAV